MSDAIASALRTIKTEREGLAALASAFENGLREPFEGAVKTIAALKGRVIVTGVGKSGHIAHKIAATLASTGTPAFYVHPSEANHGDLGMIARDDAVLALSWSGETTELGGTIAYAARFQIPVIAITSNARSTLGQAADHVLELPREKEACPNGLAPTTSSMMTLAAGDALAVALLEGRAFGPADFHVFHPGGRLGARLRFVRDVMRRDDDLPLVSTGTKMTDALLIITEKGFGCTGVVDGDGALAGIITDGDLRRNLSADLLHERVDDVMTANPRTIGSDLLAADALAVLQEDRISNLLVTDGNRPVGLINLKDLVHLGVV